MLSQLLAVGLLAAQGLAANVTNETNVTVTTYVGEGVSLQSTGVVLGAIAAAIAAFGI